MAEGGVRERASVHEHSPHAHRWRVDAGSCALVRWEAHAHQIEVGIRLFNYVLRVSLHVQLTFAGGGSVKANSKSR